MILRSLFGTLRKLAAEAENVIIDETKMRIIDLQSEAKLIAPISEKINEVKMYATSEKFGLVKDNQSHPEEEFIQGSPQKRLAGQTFE